MCLYLDPGCFPEEVCKDHQYLRHLDEQEAYCKKISSHEMMCRSLVNKRNLAWSDGECRTAKMFLPIHSCFSPLVSCHCQSLLPKYTHTHTLSTRISADIVAGHTNALFLGKPISRRESIRRAETLPLQNFSVTNG